MGAFCGIIGRADPAMVRAMAHVLKHRGTCSHTMASGHFSVAGSDTDTEKGVMLDGGPYGGDGIPLSPGELHRRVRAAGHPGGLDVRGAFAAVVRVGDAWWLLRDRLGVKPLYYCIQNGVLFFASELKALVMTGAVSKHLNLASVDRYLTLRCVAGPETIIQGVYRVQPGHALVFQAGRAVETRFASFPTGEADIDRGEAADRLREGLHRAVAETKTDAMLWSAGIDCASLAAVRAERARPVFVLLKPAWQDERWRAKESARLLGLDLDVVRARTLTENAIGQVAYHLDEPLADPTALPLWMIAEQAAKTAPLLISGHGADEILGGFPRYRLLQKARGAQRIVPMGLLHDIAPVLPPNAFVRRGRQCLASLSDSLDAYCSLASVFDEGERKALYTDAMRAVMHEKGGSASVMRPLFAGADLVRDVLALDLNVGLPDLLLTKCDRLFAAHGASLAFPYLNDSLVDFAIALPDSVRFGVRSKPLLRQAMKGLLSGRVRIRARHGFKMPQSGPAYRVIDAAARAIVTQERVESTGLFRWTCVEQVIRMATHNVYARRQFWSLLMFFAWHREFME